MIKSNGTPISSEPMKVNTKRLNDLGLIVEERGLKNQIKRLKDLIPSDHHFGMTSKYLAEQLTTIIEDLEDIKLSIKGGK